jgi:signal transduction histidine kinase
MQDEISTASNDGMRRAWIGVGVPILGLMFIVIMLAVAAMTSFARAQDRAYAVTTSRLVAAALDGRGQALSSVALDYANWDQAFERVTEVWDQQWVEGNIYSSVADGMIIFRADGSTRYAWFNEDVAPLTASIRPIAVDAGRMTPGLRQLARASTPAGTVTRTASRIGDRLLIISVAAITPEDDDVRLARPATAGVDYLALIDVVTQGEIVAMGVALDLNGVAFAPRATANADGDLVMHAVTAADGADVGVMSWRHAHPGAIAFRNQIWPVIIGLLCVGALAILIARLLVTHQMRVIAGARAAQEANQAKSEFLTRVSHELRTPLNAIIGYAEIIQEENTALETRTDAGRIISAARHLGHLLNDIIDQSRVDSGRMKITCEVLPVAGMIAEVQGLMGPTAKGAGIGLATSSSPLADFAFADHVRLRQCLVNMIGNAIKFSKRGGVVSLRARAETVGDKKMIVFDIADNGIGIAKADLAHIFRPFGQAQTIGETFGGAGLGLSISRELARQMGGDVNVVSELGKGSTFSLSVPAATAGALKRLERAA